ncbi:MAG: putative ABC transporter ATP-binding protein YxlF [Candidatus Cloacimonetes bacterium ADurb.Bin003]|nr:MAG: putative ABC transporter ATP-binding protein YxlF [Candidatus Cloacimonetes bacterium ADurb.Bin003]
MILDEPTSGLDPNQIIEIRELIRELGKEKMVLLSSHIMQEVQALCDRVVIINKGKIIVDDNIENLPNYLKRSTMLILEVQGENVDFSDFLKEYPFVELDILSRNETTCKVCVYETSGRLISSSITNNESDKNSIDETSEFDLRQELSRFIRDRGWLILEFSTSKMSLESIFHELTIENYYEPEIEEKLSAEQEFMEEEQTKPAETEDNREEQ